jgi:hypothetical protein
VVRVEKRGSHPKRRIARQKRRNHVRKTITTMQAAIGPTASSLLTAFHTVNHSIGPDTF